MSHTEYSDLFSAIKLPPCLGLTLPPSTVPFCGFALYVLLPPCLICSKIFALALVSAFEVT